jgi:hypothetical protein
MITEISIMTEIPHAIYVRNFRGNPNFRYQSPIMGDQGVDHW